MTVQDSIPGHAQQRRSILPAGGELGRDAPLVVDLPVRLDITVMDGERRRIQENGRNDDALRYGPFGRRRDLVGRDRQAALRGSVRAHRRRVGDRILGSSLITRGRGDDRDELVAAAALIDHVEGGDDAGLVIHPHVARPEQQDSHSQHDHPVQFFHVRLQEKPGASRLARCTWLMVMFCYRCILVLPAGKPGQEQAQPEEA